LGGELQQSAGLSRLRWTLMTSAGWFLGFFGGFVIAGAFEPLVGRGAIQSVGAYGLLGACTGAGVGLMQWLVLRKRIAGISAWVSASAIGMGLAGSGGYGIAVLLFGYSEGLEDLGSAAAVVGWMLAAGLGGVMTGLLQQRVLSRYLRNAGWWVPASTLAWALSVAAFGSMGVLATGRVPEDSPVGPGWFFAGLIAGGVALGISSSVAIAGLIGPQAVETSRSVRRSGIQ